MLRVRNAASGFHVIGPWADQEVVGGSRDQSAASSLDSRSCSANEECARSRTLPVWPSRPRARRSAYETSQWVRPTSMAKTQSWYHIRSTYFRSVLWLDYFQKNRAKTSVSSQTCSVEAVTRPHPGCTDSPLRFGARNESVASAFLPSFSN